MRQPGGEHLAADQSAPALVRDECFGQQTATSCRHPIGRPTETAPEGEEIRCLVSGLRPEPEELLAALRDRRKGTNRPHIAP